MATATSIIRPLPKTVSPGGPKNLPPSTSKPGAFDPAAFSKLLSGDKLKDFQALGRNTASAGGYDTFIKNAGGINELYRRYGLKGPGGATGGTGGTGGTPKPPTTTVPPTAPPTTPSTTPSTTPPATGTTGGGGSASPSMSLSGLTAAFQGAPPIGEGGDQLAAMKAGLGLRRPPLEGLVLARRLY